MTKMIVFLLKKIKKNKKMNFANLVKNSELEKDKLYVIHVENAVERRQIHSYLEKYIPNINKTSLKSGRLNSEYIRLYPCIGCDKKS